ncbi:hypothetical protein DDB_G0290773 [Dictyostelium discoideum AX4]|uniref:Methyltransferase small domain-containing protein n=1 Tax=Dictyostelium discoideum TaxID=44689 RepID=Q54FL8_DICDI|nr:hypothetical protein DDB_G0290773 [Dictyostelium discoideum AX4]EAL62060.1 hypothetical protein DDB_G0290773 [Dictyostelium discoideum AX4]|eukprot:XP_635562.1 hypothetical protein DDB_G0290773 [Dictyostelium discoideum AX4]
MEQKRLFELMYKIKNDGSEKTSIGELNITLHPNVGVGSGLISLSVSKFAKATVTGVDINPNAVNITFPNFKNNNNEIPFGGIHKKKTLNGYVLLRRYVEESKDFLTPDGSLLLGTCNFANIDSIKKIANDLDYDIIV